MDLEKFTIKLLAFLYCSKHSCYPLEGALEKNLEELYAKVMSDYEQINNEELKELKNELDAYFDNM